MHWISSNYSRMLEKGRECATLEQPEKPLWWYLDLKSIKLGKCKRKIKGPISRTRKWCQHEASDLLWNAQGLSYSCGRVRFEMRWPEWESHSDSLYHFSQHKCEHTNRNTYSPHISPTCPWRACSGPIDLFHWTVCVFVWALAHLP